MRKKWVWISILIPLILSILSLNMTRTTAANTHDIAVVNVTPHPTLVVVGELVNVTVVVENQGTENETFDLTVYHDTTTVETRSSIVLEAGLNTSLTLTWNTTDVRDEVYATNKKGKSYVINATATISLDEDPDDNTLVSTDWVKVISQYITVVPRSIMDLNLTLGNNFTVSIYTDYNGSDIWSWQFDLSYNPLVLHGVEVVNGDLITTNKDSSARYQAGTFNNALGTLSTTGAMFFFEEPPVPTTFGPGILANVTFTVVGTGESGIVLDANPATIERKTKLIVWTEDGMGEDYEIINYHRPDDSGDHVLDGFFQNVEMVFHDIAVTSVTLSPTSVVKGEFVNITVTVKNNGNVKEDVTVKIYDTIGPYQPGSSWLIETKTARDLDIGSSTSLTFAWDTTYVEPGNHTITAVASVPDDTDTLQSEQKVEVKRRQEEPIPLLLVVGIGAAIVILIAIVVYVVRRR
jgi:hypothetical protein